MGDLDQALQCQQISLDLSQRTNNPSTYATALHNLAVVYIQKGNLDKAIPLCRQRLQISEQIDDIHGIANTTLMLSQTLLEIGAAKEASEILASFGEKYGKVPLPEGIIKRMFVLRGECLQVLQQQRGKTNSAQPQPSSKRLPEPSTQSPVAGPVYGPHPVGYQPSDTNSRSSATSLPPPPRPSAKPVVGPGVGREQIQAWMQSGIERLREGDVTEGIRYLQLALEGARNGQYYEEEAASLYFLTDAFGMAGTPSKVLEYGNQALQIMRRRNFRDLEANLLNLIGKGLAGVGQMEEALPYFEQSAELAEQKQDLHAYSVALTNGAQVYMETGRPADALKILNHALTVVRQTGDQEGEISIQGGIGISYRIMKRPRDASKALLEQLRIAEALGDVGSAAAANYNLANVYGDMGQYKEAIARAERAAQLFAHVGDVAHKQQALGIAQMYRAQR